MFFYFPIKQKDGAVVGRVRVENDRATLTLTRPIDAAATLFTADGAFPILPDRPVVAAAPKALLGVRDGAPVYFGLAPGAEGSMTEWLYRLSQIQDKVASESAQIPPVSDESAQNDAPTDPNIGVNTPQDESEEMPDGEATGFSDFSPDPLIFRANAVFSRLLTLHPEQAVVPNSGGSVDDSVDKGDNAVEYTVQKQDTEADSIHAPLLRLAQEGTLPRIRLFPRIFPGASWRFVADGRLPPHYEGLWQHGGERIRILAVRGTYAKHPPASLIGFTRFLRHDGAGYWVRLLPEGRS